LTTLMPPVIAVPIAQVAPGSGAVSALAATKPLVPTKRIAEIEITETTFFTVILN